FVRTELEWGRTLTGGREPAHSFGGIIMPDSATPLLCRRPELVFCPFGDSGPSPVRDRQKGESFQLNPEAYFLLARLDSTRTAPEICAAFTDRFGMPLAEVDL